MNILKELWLTIRHTPEEFIAPVLGGVIGSFIGIAIDHLLGTI